MPGGAAEGLLGASSNDARHLYLDYLNPDPVYNNKRALSRTGGDSSLSKNCNDKCQRGVSYSSRFACLKRTFVSVVGMTGLSLDLQDLAALAGLGHEMKMYSHLSSIHWELLETQNQNIPTWKGSTRIIETHKQKP